MLDPFSLGTPLRNNNKQKIAENLNNRKILCVNWNHRAQSYTRIHPKYLYVYNIQIKIVHVWWRACVVFWLWCYWKCGVYAWGINGDNMWLPDACKTYRKIYAPNHFRNMIFANLCKRSRGHIVYLSTFYTHIYVDKANH